MSAYDSANSNSNPFNQKVNSGMIWLQQIQNREVYYLTCDIPAKGERV